MNTKTFYEVRYSYYHYNTGSANNGFFKGKYVCRSLEEAQNAASEINQAYFLHEKLTETLHSFLTDEQDNLLELLNDKYLQGDGHFTDVAAIFKVNQQEEEIKI